MQGKRNRSLADYNSLSSYKKESVFLLMFSSIGSKNSLSEIDALFDECVRKQKRRIKPPAAVAEAETAPVQTGVLHRR